MRVERIRPVLNEELTAANHSAQQQSAPAYKMVVAPSSQIIVQELCESRGGRPVLSVLTSLLASMDVKLY